MVDAGIKNIIIKKEDFPPLAMLEDGSYGYFLRYRIVSEDKNRNSHWSPIYTLSATEVPVGDGTTINLIKDVDSSVIVTPTTIIINWETTNNASLYDIFVSLKTSGTWGSYAYHGSSSSDSYSFLKPTESGITDMRIAIQWAGIEKIKNDILEISTQEFSIQASINGGGAS
jgi:hypothetical protein